MTFSQNLGMSLFVLVWGLLAMAFNRSFARIVLAYDELLKKYLPRAASRYTFDQAVILTRIIATAFILLGIVGITTELKKWGFPPHVACMPYEPVSGWRIIGIRLTLGRMAYPGVGATRRLKPTEACFFGATAFGLNGILLFGAAHSAFRNSIPTDSGGLALRLAAFVSFGGFGLCIAGLLFYLLRPQSSKRFENAVARAESQRDGIHD